MGWENDYLIMNEPPGDREINASGVDAEPDNEKFPGDDVVCANCQRPAERHSDFGDCPSGHGKFVYPKAIQA